MNECNILDQLTRTQYQTVLSHIRDVILATDIAVHLKKVGRIKAMVDREFLSSFLIFHLFPTWKQILSIQFSLWN